MCLCVSVWGGVGGTSALISWFKGVDNKQKGWNLRLFLNLPIIASRANLKNYISLISDWNHLILILKLMHWISTIHQKFQMVWKIFMK